MFARAGAGSGGVRTALVGVCALAVVGLAGCSGAGGDGSSANSAASSPSQFHRTPAEVVRGSYQATMQANSATFRMRMDSSAASSFQVHATGAMQFKPQRLRMTMQLPQGGGTMQMRQLDKSFYTKMPAQAGASLPAGKTWLQLRLDAKSGPLGRLLGQVKNQNPGQSLDYLRGIKKVTKKGHHTVDGTSTTQYHVLIDLDSLTSRGVLDKKMAQQLRRALAGHTMTTDVWLDGKDRVRRQQVTVPFENPSSGANSTMRVVMTMSDYGAPVHVTAPPKRQTVDFATLTGQQGA